MKKHYVPERRNILLLLLLLFCFSSFSSSWLQQYHWIRVVFTRAAYGSGGTLCTIKQLREGLRIHIYAGLEVICVNRDPDSLHWQLDGLQKLQLQIALFL